MRAEEEIKKRKDEEWHEYTHVLAEVIDKFGDTTFAREIAKARKHKAEGAHDALEWVLGV